MSRCDNYDNTSVAVKEARGNNPQSSHTQNVRGLLASTGLENHALHRTGLYPPPYYTGVNP